MKVVVVGGTGLIGARVVRIIAGHGHPVVAAARATGVNSFTGEGLEDALSGANVVVDVSNSSYTDEEGAREFFETSTLNLLTYGAAAGVGHHVALSVVGTDRLAASERGYFRAKFEQEQLIKAANTPFTIVHATQFFEFLGSIADEATHGAHVRLSRAMVQPMAADDVASAVANVAIGAPENGIVEFAGPDVFTLDDLVARRLEAQRDSRSVVADPLARYFGNNLGEDELLPGAGVVITPTRFEDWLKGPAMRQHLITTEG
ncbi:SDR family oxidoreductase [Conyzicola nivalis]|uniref:LysR family transcriptional regulator n=1 Tax=Conyzicola nivalis TaxID=1477021 RepID=A0A916SMM7_9MICO|nr:NmrA family NAD(P)-binding protein [Conyzicola nivalis]GGB06902.1 LysR family transcriptional regulator [Conyzicola nivalis]